ncbi:MAG: 1-acyl-sn-glycerol-3-phosphate acyltransferase [Candidatus Woesebacteria bacterium]|jgi:hypothetical protein
MERLKETGLKAGQYTLEKIISLGYNLEIKNGENLDVLNEYSDSPAIVTFNHLAKDDPFLVYLLLRRFSKERLLNVEMPISEEFAQFENYFAYAAAVRVGRGMAGFDMPEIVQSYRTRIEGADEESINEALSKSMHYGKEFAYRMREKLPSNPLIIISPEGHRSDDGKLLPAEKGVGFLVNLVSRQKKERQKKDDKQHKAHVVQVGLVYENFLGPEIHFLHNKKRAKVNLVVGKPLEVDDLMAQAENLSEFNKSRHHRISHILMTKMSNNLPKEMRGFYDDGIREETYKDRFELRTTKEGDQKVFDKDTNSFIDSVDQVTER